MRLKTARRSYVTGMSGHAAEPVTHAALYCGFTKFGEPQSPPRCQKDEYNCVAVKVRREIKTVLPSEPTNQSCGNCTGKAKQRIVSYRTGRAGFPSPRSPFFVFSFKRWQMASSRLRLS